MMHIDTSKSNGPGLHNMCGTKVNGLADVRSEDGELAFFADHNLSVDLS